MRRVSIIVLFGGWPLFNEDRSMIRIARGEILNFAELPARLQVSGHTFSTACACEKIHHL